MSNGCIGNCLKCGKCGSFTILDSFEIEDRQTEQRAGYGVAIDIGTTTVVLALIDLSTGETVSRHSLSNPQRAYGPDVISRINAANNGALQELQRLITDALSSGINTLLKAHDISRDNVADIGIAANTTMIYLLLGFPCDSLGVFPFKPAYDLPVDFILSGFNVRLVPWLAAFVGGDVLAGLLYAPKKERFLLIDLGTNGEMALYNDGKLTVTSTAAGPAFEGAARGNGASGVIDDLARLIREGHVDETGLLADNAPELFTQKEIRDIQLAKSAVRSGLVILLETAGLEYAALDAVYLAGGIGQALNVANAVTIGLLPTDIKDKVQAIGNASLGGVARLLLSPISASTDMQALIAAASEINLAEHPRFNDLFMEHMLFSEGKSMDILKLCLSMGAAKAEEIPVSELIFVPELRKFCEQNACGRYARNYTCPPSVGEVDELIAKLKAYSKAVIWQNIYPLEDSFDFEGMMDAQAKHNAMTLDIAKQVYAKCENALVLAAGGCTLCDKCAIQTNEPCRNRDDALSSLEAYGINVSKIEDVSGMKYINGKDTVTYFSGAFW